MGRYSDWTSVRTIIIDTTKPTCSITEAACTSGTLTLTLTASENIGTPSGWTVQTASTVFTK